MLTAQFAAVVTSVIAVLTSGAIAYYLSKDDPAPSGIPIFIIAFLGGFIAGAAAAMILTTSEPVVSDQSQGAASVFALVGALVGLIGGKMQASKRLSPPTERATPGHSTSSETNSPLSLEASHTKVARLEVNLGKHDQELLDHARKLAIDDNPTHINEKYIELRVSQLRDQQRAYQADNSSEETAPRAPENIDSVSTFSDDRTEGTKSGTSQVNPVVEHQRKSNYFVRHWRGDLSLTISYWINVALLSAIFTSLVTAVVQPAMHQQLSINAVRLAAILLLLYVLLYVWQFVGCWRSAEKHKTIGKSPGWGTVAQLMLVLSLLTVLAQFHQRAPALKELAKVSLGIDRLSEHQISLIDDEQIKVEGYIGFGIRDEIRNLISKHKDIWLMQLRSPGGRIGPARNLRDLIEDNQFTTYTASECSSACTIVFMGGSQRVVHQDARLGFHASALEGLTQEETRTSDAIDKAYFARRGVDQRFIEKAFNTPSSDMWYPKLQVLIESGVVTHVFDGENIIPTEQILR